MVSLSGSIRDWVRGYKIILKRNPMLARRKHFFVSMNDRWIEYVSAFKPAFTEFAVASLVCKGV